MRSLFELKRNKTHVTYEIRTPNRLKAYQTKQALILCLLGPVHALTLTDHELDEKGLLDEYVKFNAQNGTWRNSRNQHKQVRVHMGNLLDPAKADTIS